MQFYANTPQNIKNDDNLKLLKNKIKPSSLHFLARIVANKVAIFSCDMASISAIYNIILLVTIVTSFICSIIVADTSYVAAIFLSYVCEDSAANSDIAFAIDLMSINECFFL